MPTNQNQGGKQGSSRSGQQGSNRGGQDTNQGGRGFAGMDDEQLRRIAKKGGDSVSQDRGHMSEIGRKGGEASGSGNRGGGEGGRS